jgi:hypothetical protein
VPSSISTGDFNGDVRPDLVVTDSNFGSGHASVLNNLRGVTIPVSSRLGLLLLLLSIAVIGAGKSTRSVAALS